MLCREVIKKIEEVYPKDYALSWDNVGLLAGRQDKEVKKIHLALDADDRAVKHAIDGRIRHADHTPPAHFFWNQKGDR